MQPNGAVRERYIAKFTRSMNGWVNDLPLQNI